MSQVFEPIVGEIGAGGSSLPGEYRQPFMVDFDTVGERQGDSLDADNFQMPVIFFRETRHVEYIRRETEALGYWSN
jgi:hypothetical protein